MYGMPIRFEGNRAIQIPFHQQCPVVWVIPPQEPELINTLVVAEPAAIPAGGFVAGRQDVVVLAVKTAQIFLNSVLHQWSTLLLIQLTEAIRLVRSDTQVFHDISFSAPRGALIGEGRSVHSQFEFLTPCDSRCQRESFDMAGRQT